jgi:hypothetical protein
VGDVAQLAPYKWACGESLDQGLSARVRPLPAERLADDRRGEAADVGEDGSRRDRTPGELQLETGRASSMTLASKSVKLCGPYAHMADRASGIKVSSRRLVPVIRGPDVEVPVVDRARR